MAVMDGWLLATNAAVHDDLGRSWLKKLPVSILSAQE